MTKKVINVAIVGMGRGGTTVLRNLDGLTQIKVVAVADSNMEAPGIALAQKRGIFVTLDFIDLFSLPKLDVIIEATGMVSVQNSIRQHLKPGITLIEADAANLMMLLVIEREHLLSHKEIKEELSTILNSAQEGIQVADSEGTVKYVNPAFEHITGVKREDRIGKNVFEISPNGALAKVLNSGRQVKQLRNIVKGTDIEVVSNASPITVDGKITGAVVIFQDISDVARLTKELERSNSVIRSLHEELDQLRPVTFNLHDVIGRSPSLKKVIKLAEMASKANANVLLLGESGTGKEVIANAIHHESSRRDHPFVKINCAAIPENLLESELFGYEKGAFTGAVKSKEGKFELANNGTIFLDEIGDLSLSLQAKLLRVLQEREFERVGGPQTIKVDIRIIAATNRNLEWMVQNGGFRQDLYYRLNVLEIFLPPLKDRVEDIPLLVNHIIKKLNFKLGKNISGVDLKALDIFKKYHWPGNIRELENILERAMLLTEGNYIKANTLNSYLELEPAADAFTDEADKIFPLDKLEKEMLLKALKKYGRSVAGKKAAAKALNISLSTLYYKLNQYQEE